MRNLSSVLALFFALLILTPAARAAELPPALEAPLFRLILTDTPEGMELAERLLGRELSDVTAREADEALQALRSAENQALAQDLAARVREIEGGLETAGRRFRSETERVVFVQELTVRELPIESEADEGLVRFRGGETHPIQGTYGQARARFAQGASAESVARREGQALSRARTALERAEPGERMPALLQALEASLRAVRSLEDALAAASADGRAPVSPAQKARLQDMASRLLESGVEQRMSSALSPAARNRHARLLAEYASSWRKLEGLANRITFLPVL